MSRFESGVTDYIIGYTVVSNAFPVDKYGKAEINCANCYYYRNNVNRCGLNNEVCYKANSYVGDSCPLRDSIQEALKDFDKGENENA